MVDLLIPCKGIPVKSLDNWSIFIKNNSISDFNYIFLFNNYEYTDEDKSNISKKLGKDVTILYSEEKKSLYDIRVDLLKASLKSESEYVYFIDVDDVLKSNELVSWEKSNIVRTPMVIQDVGRNIIYDKPSFEPKVRYMSLKDSLLNDYPTNSTGVRFSKSLIKKSIEFLNDAYGEGLNYGEDFILFYIIARDSIIEYKENPIYLYNINSSESVTHNVEESEPIYSNIKNKIESINKGIDLLIDLYKNDRKFLELKRAMSIKSLIDDYRYQAKHNYLGDL